jgi:putative transposase
MLLSNLSRIEWIASLKIPNKMARANRHHIPGYVWHITHRCHKREFLLKFDKEKVWRKWLFEARKRHGMCILNYTITSNHTHLLVLDKKENVIPKSIQLIAGRTGREYNRRKKRKGAFWEDRYHATAVQTGNHLIQCMVYIDLNMVRAGVVEHPKDWEFGGYHEIQQPRQRYTLIDREMLCHLLGILDEELLAETIRKWIDETLSKESICRETKWTKSIAVGDVSFVMETKKALGAKALGRNTLGEDSNFQLRESVEPYNSLFPPEKGVLRTENTFLWNVNPKITEG